MRPRAGPSTQRNPIAAIVLPFLVTGRSPPLDLAVPHRGSASHRPLTSSLFSRGEGAPKPSRGLWRNPRQLWCASAVASGGAFPVPCRIALRAVHSDHRPETVIQGRHRRWQRSRRRADQPVAHPPWPASATALPQSDERSRVRSTEANEGLTPDTPVTNVPKPISPSYRLIQKLLQTHSSFRKNYLSLQRSEKVLTSFTSMCISALKEGQLLEQLAATLVTRSEEETTDTEETPSLSPSTSSVVCVRVVGGRSHQSAESPQYSYTVLLPVAAVDILRTPVSLPELPMEALFQPAGLASGSSSAAGSPWQRWMQYWDVWTGGSQAEQPMTTGGPGASYVAVLTQAFAPPSVSTPKVGDMEASLLREGIGQMLPLLHTLAFFKWAKDEAILLGDDAKGSRHQAMMQLDALRTDFAALRAARGGADHSEPYSVVEQRMIDHSRAILDAVPKWDRWPDASASPAEEKCVNSSLPVYTVHVIDLLLGLLGRCALVYWPHLRPADRGLMFRLVRHPWTAQDLLATSAPWYTFLELSALTTPHSQAADPAAYVQQMRLLCWPTMTDYRSSITQRTLGETHSMAEESASSGAVAGHHTSLNDVIAVVSSTEHKQRLAYELLYWFLLAVRPMTTAAPLTTMAGSWQRSEDSPHMESFRRAAGTMSVYLADVDRFMTERCYDPSARPTWVLLDACRPPEVASSLHAELRLQHPYPYLLTRATWRALAEPLAPLWPDMSSKRLTLLWKALVRSADSLLHRVSTMLTTSEDADKTAAAAEVWAVAAPLVTLMRCPRANDVMGRRLLTELRLLQKEPLVEGGIATLQALGHVAGLLVAAARSTPRLRSAEDQRLWEGNANETFHAAVMQTLSAHTNLNEVHQLMNAWPKVPNVESVDPAVSEVRPLDFQAALTEVIFTPSLAAEVRTWAERREVVESREELLTGVESAALRQWYTQIQEDEVGLQPFPVSLRSIYAVLAALVVQVRMPPVQPAARTVNETASEATGECAGGTSEGPSGPHTLPLPIFQPAELTIILRVLSYAFARGGLNTVTASAPSIFEGLLSVAVARDAVPVASVGEPSKGSTLKCASSACDSSGTPPAEPSGTSLSSALDPTTVRARLHTLEQSLKASVAFYLPKLPLTTLLDSVFLGISNPTCIGVAMGLQKNVGEVGSAGESGWVEAGLRQVRQLPHPRLVTGLLLVKHFTYLMFDPRSPVCRSPPVHATGIIFWRLLHTHVGESCANARSLPAPLLPVRDDGSNGGALSMMEYARRVTTIHALVVVLFVEESQSRLPPLYQSTRSASHSPYSLYAVLLVNMSAVLPSLSRGSVEELFLWLSAASHVVSRKLVPPPAATPSESVLSAVDAPVWLPPTAPSSTTPPTADLTAAVHHEVGSRHTETCSVGADMASALEQWCAYIFSQMIPHVQSLITWQSQVTPNARVMTATMMAARTMESLGVTIPWQHLDGAALLQRSVGDRRFISRHFAALLATTVSHASLHTAFMPLAAYVRDAGDTLAPGLLPHAFIAIELCKEAMQHSHECQAASRQQEDKERHDVLDHLLRTAATTNPPSATADDSIPPSNEDTVPHNVTDGVSGSSPPSGLTRTVGTLPHYVSSPAALRTAWAALARRVLEREAATCSEADVLRLLILALRSGCVVGCADTHVFEHLLAFLVMGHSGSLVRQMGLLQWAEVLTACETTSMARATYSEVLEVPLLNFCADVVARHDAFITKSPAPVCTFLESLCSLYVATDGFWLPIRNMVDTLAARSTTVLPTDVPSNGKTGGEKTAAATWWALECKRSFNWSVRVAGHPHLMFTLD